MKFIVLLALATCAFAQPPVRNVDVSKALADQIAPPSSDPDRVVATFDGVKVTAGELFRFYAAQPSTLQLYFAQNRKELLDRYATSRKLMQESVDNKLDQKAPYKGRLESARETILLQARMEEIANEQKLSEEAIRKFYDTHLDDFTTGATRGILVPNNDNEAQKKAAAIVKRIRGGEEFAKVAKETSADRRTGESGGGLGGVSKTGPYPAEFKKVIFSLKPGEVSEPVDFHGSLWIFGLDSLQVREFDTVKDEVIDKMKQDSVENHLQAIRKKLTYQIQDEKYFEKLAVPESFGLGGEKITVKPNK